MRDNAFDKGVQEKMEEFRLSPSAPVWPEVERRIRERKKRRILIFWFCLAGLLITGAGAWWMLHEKTVNPSLPVANNHNISVQPKSDTSDIANNNPLLADSLTKNKNNSTTTTTTTLSANEITEKAPVAGASDAITRKNNVSHYNHQQGSPVNAAPFRKRNTGSVDNGHEKRYVTTGNGKKSKRTVLANKQSAPVDTKPEPPANTVIAGNEQRAVSQDFTTDPKTTVQAAAIPAPVAVQGRTADKADTGVVTKTDEVKPATTAIQSKKKQHKWQTGFVLAFGEAKLTESRFSLFSEKRFDALQSGVSTGSGNFNNQSFADSLPLKGPAFHAGVFAKRKMGKKTAFSIGANLAYYSGKQRVGAFVDSVRQLSNYFSSRTAGGFYRSGSSDWYTNRYYYLQVPLLLHWQINKGTKLPPMEWENGFVPSLLTGSRALVYDPASTIFFSDKTVYNRFSLVYQTGFTATFASRTRHPLTAGFYYNYHFSKLQGVNPPDFNHQSSYGIQFRWLLRK